MMTDNPPFSITNEMLSLVASIVEKTTMLNSCGNLSRYPILRKQNRIKSIHSSCAIEQNSLSLDQVTNVINGKKVIGPQKDILEIQNAINAYNRIEEVNPFVEEEIKSIQFEFTKNIIPEAGQYRSCNECVSDEKGNIIFVAPPPILVPKLMSSLFCFINKEHKNIHPLILSSVFHYEFVFIHPFKDGNGRTARYWQNAILGKWNKLCYWIPIENQIHKYQDDYYNAISKSNINGNSNAFIIFMLKMIDKTFRELIDDTASIDTSLSIYVYKLLKALRKNTWYTSNQILSILNLKSKKTLRKNYLDPAIENKIMVIEFPDKPTSKNQRYKII